MRAARHACSAVLAAFLLGGCAIGPNFKRPETSAPAGFKGYGSDGDRSIADQDWTDVYTDPRLQELIKAALANGFDARIAAARVGEYRAMAAQVHGMLLPSVGYEANADRGRNAVLGNPFSEGGTIANGFDGYLSAAWEFDLWGRVRRLDEAARAQYLASEEARRGVLLSLVSDVVTAYYELLELDEERAIAVQTTASFADSLRLFQRQLEGGVVSRLDTETAKAALAASKARIPDIERQISIKETEISLLIGANPGPLVRGARLVDQEAPTDVPAGLPSALLERRPDVREAEEEAHAANAGIGVTLGGFLPRIGLSAILGGVSSDLNSITTRQAGLWSVGAGASGPLFQGGGLRGQYDASKEAWEMAKLQYQQTALAAFGDVSNALVTRKMVLEIRVEQEAAVKAYEEAVTLSTERYKAGKASYFEVIQAQEALFPAEITLAQTRKDQFTAVVQLYKALGGGWKSAGLAPKE
jgi:multidrug efflux system outer membrane protein